MDLGRNVYLRRTELGMSQEELAFKMGYKSRTSINKIENGRPVTQKIIVRLAEALQTTPAHLMGWDSEENDAASDLLDESLAGVTDSDQFEENKQLWISEVGTFDFTPEEMKQIIGFAKYILSQRKE